ncbi:MAG: hypothetical protein IPH12_09435 [Saprospirales bacterium]|jgi:hypothetical protein|nr:hypothetical protein [Saprospirales bacterium]MBK8921054.1 hypothetical protein [Saprospirales bacterium]
MTIRLFACLLSVSVGYAFAPPLPAQNDEEMAKVFNWKFQLVAPDTSFIPMDGESGWEEPGSEAKVICMATPAPYTRVVEDFAALQSEPGQVVLDKSYVTLGGVTGLLLLLEFAPVAGEETELTYSLLFARPYGEVSLLLSAQYPKPEHDRLYAKILASFATVRQINE